MPQEKIKTAAGAARTQAKDWRDSLARVGLAAEGVFNIALGLLVVRVALVDPGEEAGPEGAAEEVVNQPFGQAMLIVLILGLVCLVAWRGVQLFTGDEVEGSGLQDRLKYFGMAVVYTLIIGIATTVLLQSFGVGGGLGNGEDPEEEATAFVLDWPGGEFLVGAAGLGFIVVGLFGMYTYGIRAEFMDRIDRERTGQALEHKIQVIGRVGYVGRSVVNLVIGFLVILAAVRHDPDEASGMPEALGKLADETWGVALLLFIGLGFFLYATLRLIEARYRKDSRAG